MSACGTINYSQVFPPTSTVDFQIFLTSSHSAQTHLFPYNSHCHGDALTRAQSLISRMHGAFQVNESFLVGSCVLTAGGRPLRHPGGVFHVFITLGILFQCYSGGTVAFHRDILWSDFLCLPVWPCKLLHCVLSVTYFNISTHQGLSW